MHDKFSPKGLQLQDLCRGPLDIHCIKYISYNLMVSDKIFLCFPIISLWESLIHRVWPVWIPGA